MEERDILLMAALIASVRTIKFESREFQGMNSPRMRCEVSNSIALARLIVKMSKMDVAQRVTD